MAFPSFGQNWIRAGGAAPRPRFSDFRHNFVPRRVNLFVRRNQQGGRAAITDYFHPLTALGPVKHCGRLLVQLLGSDLGHV